MIDKEGYRLNVGMVICNFNKQVVWAKRYAKHSWQFPQGGINFGETTKQAMYRELFEEIGLSRQDVRILTATNNWLKYKIPTRLIRQDHKSVYIGQKQKWFLLQLMCPDTKINTQRGDSCEFDDWCWVSYWYPIRQVVYFKKEVYNKVMKEFSNFIRNSKRM